MPEQGITTVRANANNAAAQAIVAKERDLSIPKFFLFKT